MSDARNNNVHAGNADNADRTLFLPGVSRRSPFDYRFVRATSPRGECPANAIYVDDADVAGGELFVRGSTPLPGVYEGQFEASSDDAEEMLHRAASLALLVDGDRLSPLVDMGSTPRKFLFPAAITTASFLADVLNSRISMVAMLQSAGYDRPDLTIPEADLRALFMKALFWFIERECLADVLEARIVLVGRAVDEPFDDLCPSLSVRQLQIIAAELPDALASNAAAQDFDTFMFHAGRYFKKNSPYSTIVLVVQLVVTVFAIYITIYCTAALVQLML